MASLGTFENMGTDVGFTTGDLVVLPVQLNLSDPTSNLIGSNEDGLVPGPAGVWAIVG